MISSFIPEPLKQGISTMPNAHLNTLAARHAQLEASLMREGQRPAPDSVRLAELKREKLRLKEAMAQLH